MDEGNNDDNEKDVERLERDIKIMERAMEEEIEGALDMVEPVCQVL